MDKKNKIFVPANGPYGVGKWMTSEEWARLNKVKKIVRKKNVNMNSLSKYVDDI